MKRLLVQEGGRELVYDDLLQLEEVTRATTVALCAAASFASAFVLQGCRVTQTGATVRVSGGVVYISGQLLRLNAVADLTLPLEIVTDAAPVTSDDRRYEDGSTHPGAAETFAIVRAATSTPTGKIQITDTAGGLTYAMVLAAAARPLGAIEHGAFDPAGFAVDGRGIGLHRGWALCDGRNGTTDLRGRFVAGYCSPSMEEPNGTANLPEWQTVGARGGNNFVRLEVAHLPPHTHDVPQGESFLGTGASGRFGRGNNGAREIAASVVGEGVPHENRPPFTVLVARQWIGF